MPEEQAAGNRPGRPPREPEYALKARLVASSLRRAGVSAGEAEEVAQEAIARSFQRAPNLAAGERPAWLRTVATNIVRDRWRRSRSQDERRPLLLAAAELVASSAEEAALANLEAELLRAALDRLSSDARLVLCLRVLERRSAREVGSLLGRSEEAVRQLQLRALRQLRRLLLESGWQGARTETTGGKR